MVIVKRCLRVGLIFAIISLIIVLNSCNSDTSKGRRKNDNDNTNITEALEAELMEPKSLDEAQKSWGKSICDAMRAIHGKENLPSSFLEYVGKEHYFDLEYVDESGKKETFEKFPLELGRNLTYFPTNPDLKYTGPYFKELLTSKQGQLEHLCSSAGFAEDFNPFEDEMISWMVAPDTDLIYAFDIQTKEHHLKSITLQVAKANKRMAFERYILWILVTDVDMEKAGRVVFMQQDQYLDNATKRTLISRYRGFRP